VNVALVWGRRHRQFPSPDAYTPKHLAEKILTSKTALEGERKRVTVLFADLKGSMELLAEEARKRPWSRSCTAWAPAFVSWGTTTRRSTIGAAATSAIY
jgi:class 3 adenylate cyclase